jgi:hypothetical protein
MFYRAAGVWTWTTAEFKYYHMVSSVPQYDNAGTIGPVGVSKYSMTWVYWTNSPSHPVAFLMGQSEHNTQALAEAVDPASIVIGDFVSAEWRLLYKIVWQRNGAVITYKSTTDYRRQLGSAGSFVATDHGALSGLADDDHPQYVRGPAAAVANVVPVFDGTTGKLLKESLLYSAADGGLSITGTGDARGAGAIDLQTVRANTNEVASGAYAVIGGGSSNKASADFAVVTGGSGNVASDIYAVLAGEDNTASGTHAVVAGGAANTAGYYASVGGGNLNLATGPWTTVGGGLGNSASGYYTAIAGGKEAQAFRWAEQAHAAGMNAVVGDAQRSDHVLRGITTTDTQLELSANPLSGSVQLFLQADSTNIYEAHIVARQQDVAAGNAAYIVQGCVVVYGTTAELLGAPIITTVATNEYSEDWALAVDVDNSYGVPKLKFLVTGETGKTIYWVAHVALVEVVAIVPED